MYYFLYYKLMYAYYINCRPFLSTNTKRTMDEPWLRCLTYITIGEHLQLLA